MTWITKLLLIFLLVLLPTYCLSALDNNQCLPGSSGEIVAHLVAQKKIKSVTPKDWILVSANIDKSILTFTFRNDLLGQFGVIFKSKKNASGLTAGHWFSYEFFGNNKSLDQKTKKQLLKVANLVDQSFPSSPWISCDKSRPSPISNNTFILLFLLASISILAVLYWQRRIGKTTYRVIQFIENHDRLILFFVLIPIAALRLVHLDIPFDGDYATQRVFFGSLDWSDILAHNYADSRHPQLFYLVLHVFLWFGHAEWIARLPAVVFSITTLISLFYFTRPYLGKIRSLVVVVVLGLSTSYLHHSRDVSDVTLFLTLAFMSSHFLLSHLRSPKLASAILFSLSEIAMFYSYYMSVLIVICHLATLAVFGRRAEFRTLWYAFGSALIAALPAMLDFASVFIGDQPTRQVASQYPTHVWGDRKPLEFLAELYGLLYPAGFLGIWCGILSLWGGYRFIRRLGRQPIGFFIGSLLAVSAMVVLVGVFIVRLKPYYLIYLLPISSLLLVIGGLGTSPKDSYPMVTKNISLTAFIVAMVFLIFNFSDQLPSHYDKTGHGLYLEMSKSIKHSGGADTVIADPECLHTILVYYLFPNPKEMYRTCRMADDIAYKCDFEKKKMITLTRMPKMNSGWQERSLQKLQRIDNRPYWFVYTRRFINQPLEEYLSTNCQKHGDWDHLTLFRCIP
jgi:hypothetical protein